jgi:hypothetical protein
MSNWNELRSLIPQPCHDRPFVCDGLPDSCEVIVIGENPATKTRSDWWKFWSDEGGFDLQQFERTYEKARVDAKKPKVSATRARLRILRDAGLRCLETNVFINERLDGAGENAQTNPLLKVFFRRLPNLKAVVVHGTAARRAFRRIDSAPPVEVYFTKHFSRASFDSIRELATKIQDNKSKKN